MSGAATGPPSGRSKPPCENDCVHLSAEAKFRSKATPGGGRRAKLVWGRLGVVHEMELCAM